MAQKPSPLDQLKSRKTGTRRTPPSRTPQTRKKRNFDLVKPLANIQPQQAQTAVTGPSTKLWLRTFRLPTAWKILVEDICKEFQTVADGHRWIVSMGLWAYDVQGQRPFFDDPYERRPQFYYNGVGKGWQQSVRIPRPWQQKFREIHMDPEVRCKTLGDTETWLFGMGLWAYYEAGQRPSFDQKIKIVPQLYEG